MAVRIISVTAMLGYEVPLADDGDGYALYRAIGKALPRGFGVLPSLNGRPTFAVGQLVSVDPYRCNYGSRRSTKAHDASSIRGTVAMALASVGLALDYALAPTLLVDVEAD